jgi:two-component system phosphate regulon response regulator PhoB
MNRPKILIVEDEPDLRDLLRHHLAREGFEIHETGDGHEALRLAIREQPDILILDLLIEGLQGLQVCRRIKSVSSGPPARVIIVSGLGDEDDVLRGLDAGADDYIPKPFRPREVVARVRTVLRRARAPGRPDDEKILRAGPLFLDPASHEARLHERPLELTHSEFRLLRFLLAHPGRVFDRAQLLARFGETRAELVGRNIDVHIRALRMKLGAHADLISTVRGVGYRLLAPAEHAPRPRVTET